MSAPVIEARQLQKTFAITPILRGVDLDVEAGAALLIHGRNGSGKSTLIRLLAGLSAPSAGSALLFGSPSYRLGSDLRRRVGLLTHQSFLYPNLTARENLRFFASLFGIVNVAQVTQALLEQIGLAAAADERVRSFSHGMEQRLALIRALLPEPDVLLTDEPFTALDPEGIARAGTLLEGALRRGCAIVMTAHEAALPIEIKVTFKQLVRGRLSESDSTNAKRPSVLPTPSAARV